MKPNTLTARTVAVTALTAVLSFGCAATQIALEKKDLQVQTQMSETIFLDAERPTTKTVYLDIRNTSDKDIDLVPHIRGHLETRGYTVASKPSGAFYILQGNILYVGKADPSALREALTAGYGAPLGGATGAMIGGATGGWVGAGYGGGIGTVLGGVAEVVSGALVKDVSYTIVTDLQIAEKASEKVQQTVASGLKQGTGTTVIQASSSTRNRRKYQTRIVQTANKVNLQYEEAAPLLVTGLAKSIGGIF